MTNLLATMFIFTIVGVIALIPAAIGTGIAGPLGGVVVWCFSAWLIFKL